MKIDTSGKTIYWCKTRESAERFLKDCLAQGIEWNSGFNINKNTYWAWYKENTVYVIAGEKIHFCAKQDVEYSVDLYMTSTIVDCEEFYKEEDKKEETLRELLAQSEKEKAMEEKIVQAVKDSIMAIGSAESAESNGAVGIFLDNRTVMEVAKQAADSIIDIIREAK